MLDADIKNAILLTQAGHKSASRRVTRASLFDIPYS
jgi:hypothetical protein